MVANDSLAGHRFSLLSVACRSQLDLFTSCLTRCSVVAAMKSAASSSSAQADAATSAHPSVLLAACQLPATPAQTKDIKLNVIMRGAALDSADHVEKACTKLRPEAPANDLRAAQRVDSTCAPPPRSIFAGICAHGSIRTLRHACVVSQLQAPACAAHVNHSREV